MSSVRKVRVRTVLLLLSLSLPPLTSKHECLLAGEATPSAASDASKEGPPGGMTLDAWRALKKTAQEVLALPRGPERIAKCEAFLKEHPEYPQPEYLLRWVVNDTLETGSYDPLHVALLLQEVARPLEKRPEGTLGENSAGLMCQVEEYHFKYNLPVDSTERLLNRIRQILERERLDLEKEMDPATHMESRRWISDTAFRLLLAEGRLLLARGDEAAALKKLREAEESGKEAGALIVLRDPRGKESACLPSGESSSDWLNLSLAEAYARIGDTSAALERIGRVRGFGRSPGELMARLERLREEMKVPLPAAAEVRADPVPAADFSLKDLDGNTVSLSDFRHKVVLVQQWTTW